MSSITVPTSAAAGGAALTPLIETRPHVLAILANMAKWDADQLLKKQRSKFKRSEAAKKAWAKRRAEAGVSLERDAQLLA
jgi:hypothetical protein